MTFSSNQNEVCFGVSGMDILDKTAGFYHCSLWKNDCYAFNVSVSFLVPHLTSVIQFCYVLPELISLCNKSRYDGHSTLTCGK